MTHINASECYYCLIGTKSLSEPMLDYCRLDFRNKILRIRIKVGLQEMFITITRKLVWKCRLQNVVHFVSASMFLLLVCMQGHLSEKLYELLIQPVFALTCWNCYNAVNFLPNLHKIHPIARPLGRGMGCNLWFDTDLYSALVNAVLYEISCYIGPRYNRTRL